MSDLWIVSSFPCLFSTAGWGQVGVVDVSPLDASNASNRALTIAARFQIGSGAGDFKVPLETRRCRDYQAVEWSKSRSWASDRFVRSVEIWAAFWNYASRACTEIIRGETEVRKLFLQWGSVHWTMIGLLIVRLLEEFHPHMQVSGPAHCSRKSENALLSAKTPRLLVILSGLLQLKGRKCLALFGPRATR